jgi:hypothetical protein
MNLTKHIKILDIEYYDGPMLSLFKDEKEDSFYLYKWLDVEQNGHKWLIFKTNHDNLYDYIYQNIDEKTLIQKAINGQYATVIIEPDLTYSHIKRFTTASLPTTFLPAKNCFFTQSDCPDYDVLIKFLEDMALNAVQLMSEAA